MTLRYSTDIVIFGGGIAGLWLLNRLRNEGYHPLLLETGRLGGGQTFASQGIVHGGLKYALSGSLTGAANVIASMPERWRLCLSGSGDVDLSGVSILSDHYYMWSNGSLRSRLKSFLGSKSLVGRVQTLEQKNYPKFFKNNPINGTLYELPDFVIDSSSLINKLRENGSSSILSLSEGSYCFRKSTESSTYSLELSIEDQVIEIEAKRFVFTAGEGNTKLIAQTGMQSVKTQVRPLHMVYLRSSMLPNAFVHCVGDNFSLTPKLTITSHKDKKDRPIWYLGGELAEEGVIRNQTDQIDTAKQLLKELFPALDIADAEWNSFVINRAEPDTNNNYRPDDAFLAVESNLLAAWPTKFTLTPALADKVVNTLRNDSVSAVTNDDARDALIELLAEPELAQAYWD